MEQLASWCIRCIDPETQPSECHQSHAPFRCSSLSQPKKVKTLICANNEKGTDADADADARRSTYYGEDDTPHGIVNIAVLLVAAAIAVTTAKYMVSASKHTSESFSESPLVD